MTAELHATVHDLVSPVALPLHEGMAAGLADARSRLGTMGRIDEAPHLIALATRHAARNYFMDGGLPPRWRVEGKPYLMGQVIVEGPGVSLRVLKERRRSYPGGVPVAGSGRARQLAWSNVEWDLMGDPKPETLDLLCVWDYRDDGISIRVVRPLHPGVYGSPVKLDVSYEVRPGGELFSTSRFAGGDDDTDLYEETVIDTEGNEKVRDAQ